MTIDDLATFITANINTYISTYSTPSMPLALLTADQIYTRNYALPAKNCTVFLDPQDETVEPLTMSTLAYRLPVDILVFTQGETEANLRAKARAYTYAVLDCIATHPDFMTVENRSAFDGVEGKDDIKASKITAIFEYEEAL
jgi:hypothetical protein